MVLFLLPISLAFLMILWLDTHAVIEYTDLIKLYKIIPILQNYYNVRQQGSDCTFVSYLNQFYNGFFVRLITCEICISTWLGLIGGSFFSYYNYIHYGILFSIFYGFCLPYFILLAYRIIKKLNQ